jgi:hypothetical protein
MTHQERHRKRTQYRLFIWKTCLLYPMVRVLPISPHLWLLNCVNLIESRLPSLRTTSQTFSLQPFVVDKDGEMPEGYAADHSRPSSGPSTNPPQFTSFAGLPRYPTRSQTPDPITVMRTKKKGLEVKSGLLRLLQLNYSPSHTLFFELSSVIDWHSHMKTPLMHGTLFDSQNTLAWTWYTRRQLAAMSG